MELVAYETCLYLSLKDSGIQAEPALERTVLLFFKSLLAPPFTLVFETLFVLWITNKLNDYRAAK